MCKFKFILSFKYISSVRRVEREELGPWGAAEGEEVEEEGPWDYKSFYIKFFEKEQKKKPRQLIILRRVNNYRLLWQKTYAVRFT